MILTVTPNPCVDKTVFIDVLEVGTFMRSPRCETIPGGKGVNVARAVNALGRPAKALAVVGGHPGAHVVDMIRHGDGVPCVPVWVASQTRTITTILEESIHRQTAFFEPGSRVTAGEYGALVETFREAVTEAEVAVFSGTVSDKAIARLYEELIPIARDAGALTILDSHGPEFAKGLEQAPYMVKPNIAETEELFGYALDSFEARWRAVGDYHGRGASLVALSMGAEGALVSCGGERFHAAPPQIEEVNPVGSGDCLVAGFAIGLLEGMDLEAMARLGCAAGAANAMTWDIGHFAPSEVAALRDRVQIRR